MVRFFKLPRYILWPLYLILNLATLFLLILVTGVGWLSSDTGTAYIQRLVRTKLSDGVGYRIEAKDIRFQFPLTARISKLSLSDTKGVWIEADAVVIYLLPAPTIRQHLVIREFSADAIQLLRIPEPAAKARNSEGVGTDISVSGVAIKEISLASAVTGLEEDLLGSLSGSIGLSALTEQLNFEGKADIKRGMPVLVTGELSASGIYRLQGATLNVSSFQFSHPSLNISGNLGFQFASNEIQAAVKVDSLKLEEWVRGVAGKVDIDTRIAGTFKKPSFNATIRSQKTIYKEKIIPNAVTELNGTLGNDGWHGGINIETADAGQALASYRWSPPALQLDDIAVHYLKNKIAGNFLLDTTTLIARGKLEAKIPAIEQFSDYLPESVSGKAALSIRLSGEGGRQGAFVILDLQKLEARQVNISAAHVELDIPDLKAAEPKSIKANLSKAVYEDVSVSKAMLVASRKKGGWRASFAAEGNTQQPFRIKANGDLGINRQNEWNAVLTTLEGTYGKTAFSSTDKITLTIGDGHQSVAVPKLKIGHGNFSVDADRKNTAVFAVITGDYISLPEFVANLPDELKDSRAAFTLKVNGDVGTPQAVLDAHVTGIKLHVKSQESIVKLTAKIQNGKASVSAIADTKPMMRSNLNAHIPVNFSLEPFVLSIEEQSPIKGDTEFAFDVSALSGLLLSSEHVLKGDAKGKLALSGSYAAPVMSGEIQFQQGGYSYLPLNVKLQNINATIVMANRTFTLAEFYAGGNKRNILTAKGSADFTSISDFIYRLNLNANQLPLINHPNARGIISGDLTFQGNHQAGKISGKLKSDSLAIYLPDRLAGSVPELNVVDASSSSVRTAGSKSKFAAYPITLDVILEADNKVFVRGWGVDAELQGKLALRGNISDPKVEGKLGTIRGRYEEFGKQFKLKNAELVFQGDIPPSPYLNIVGVTTASNVEIRPVISGPVLEPTLKIESSPAMPQEEALALLLFGKDFKKISSIQAVQLANSLAKLSGKGGASFDLIGKARDFLGVDDVKINSNDENAGDTSIGVGKYIGDNTYLEVERGSQTGSGKARVEIEITPNISVESNTGGAGDSSVGVNWKRDY